MQSPKFRPAEWPPLPYRKKGLARGSRKGGGEGDSENARRTEKLVEERDGLWAETPDEHHRRFQHGRRGHPRPDRAIYGLRIASPSASLVRIATMAEESMIAASARRFVVAEDLVVGHLGGSGKRCSTPGDLEHVRHSIAFDFALAVFLPRQFAGEALANGVRDRDVAQPGEFPRQRLDIGIVDGEAHPNVLRGPQDKHRGTAQQGGDALRTATPGRSADPLRKP